MEKERIGRLERERTFGERKDVWREKGRLERERTFGERERERERSQRVCCERDIERFRQRLSANYSCFDQFDQAPSRKRDQDHN